MLHEPATVVSGTGTYYDVRKLTEVCSACCGHVDESPSVDFAATLNQFLVIGPCDSGTENRFLLILQHFGSPCVLHFAHCNQSHDYSIGMADFSHAVCH